MLDITLKLIESHWALIVGCGAFLAACLVCIRDFLTIRKLRLELSQLKSVAARRDSLISIATLEQIERYAGPRSDGSDFPQMGRMKMKGRSFKWILVIVVLAIFAVYMGVARTTASVVIALVVYVIVRWILKRMFLASAL
jgi:cobalamin synthase